MFTRPTKLSSSIASLLCSASLLVAFVCLFSVPHAIAKRPLVITQGAPEYPGDTRYVYGNLVLKLALEETKEDFGGYYIQDAPSMIVTRAIRTLKSDEYENYIYPTPYDEKLDDISELSFIPFPIIQGLLGYRVCFHSEGNVKKIKKAVEGGDILNLSHAQGSGWTDVKVLRHNKFKVLEVDNHQSLFRMTGAGRVDLFCRGANEVFEEYNQFSDVKGLAFDRSFVIHYDLPVFFYAHKASIKAMERIKAGLIRAHENGKLKQLLFQHYGRSIDFVSLDKRKLFQLENPSTLKLDPAYKKYNMTPLSLKSKSNP